MIPINEPSRHTVPAQERIEILDRISRAVTQAERSTMDLTGGQAVCQLHKDGRVTGGVKYREGRLVALYNLRRRVAVLEDGELARASDEVRDECATWQEIIDRQRNTERPSVSWLAYGQGGMDACQEIMQQLP